MSKSLTDVYDEIIEAQARDGLIIPVLRAFADEIREETLRECADALCIAPNCSEELCDAKRIRALSRPEDKP